MSRPVVFSCVVDDAPKFTRQAILWASSLLTFANQTPESLLVHVTDRCDPQVRRVFGAMGIETQEVACFDVRHGPSNKLGQLETGALTAAEYVVLCDCDLAFCQDISSAIGGDCLRAKIVDKANLSLDQWKRIFAVAALSWPETNAKSTFDKQATLPGYCNGGLLILPQPAFTELRHAWPKWNRWLIERPQLLETFAFFTDQISLALTLAELRLCIEPLPLEYNFPTHLPYGVGDEPERPPLVLHYHDHVDERGSLLPTGLTKVDAHIAKINRLIQTLEL